MSIDCKCGGGGGDGQILQVKGAFADVADGKNGFQNLGGARLDLHIEVVPKASMGKKFLNPKSHYLLPM